MDMLSIMRERLIEGLTIVKYKEYANKYVVTLAIGSKVTTVDLLKNCAPGYHNDIVDRAIWTALSSIYLNMGDLVTAKKWLDKLCGGN